MWFTDLTQPDHLFILPALYILTMMASQEITIRNTATQQKQLMRFLPLVFGFFLARFPSGLFVYWITSNCITFAQNYVIYYVLPHKKTADVEVEETTEAEKKTPSAAKKEEEKRKVPQNQQPAQQPKKSGRAKNRKKKKVSKRR